MEPDFAAALLKVVTGRRRLKGLKGGLRGSTTPVYRHLLSLAGTNLEPSIIKAEQSNTSLVYGDQLIMKLYRRLEAGTNPDQEIGRFLTEKGFAYTPPQAGTLEYQKKPGAPMTIALLQGFVPNMGDAWQFTLDSLNNYFPQALASHADVPEVSLSTSTLLDLAEQSPPPLALDLLGSYLDAASLLGKRTAEMHLALSEGSGNPSFTPEAFTSFYQRSIYQSMRNLLGQVFHTIRSGLKELPPPVQEDARVVLKLRDEILGRFRSILNRKIAATRIRCHGDYHLGQLLRTANDFMIIDFEGEPARSLSERRIKRCALRDVAGMLRSFHYASHVALLNQITTGAADPADLTALQLWARFWNTWVSTAFLKAYLVSSANAAFVPKTRGDLQVLDAFSSRRRFTSWGTN